MKVIYSIVIERWSGIFSAVWYADVFSSEDQNRIATFNAFTKRGARAKAARYIRKMHGDARLEGKDITVFAYDARSDMLETIAAPEAALTSLGR